MPDDKIDWEDRSAAAAQLVGAFGVSLAHLIALYDTEGRYDDLISGFREGRYSLALARDTLTVQEAAPVPPTTPN
jgi:hypothetical protein